ncbi:methyltransferase domain-containing protein [Marinoscillum sp. MHG1-6]|uniref:methyltransferase domain-containing protein n=1 Tax=Marinoscillum sp. MHG1-6 TaxID=2959627 RepID=UPI002157E636|nr:methyltransferase domain-containing protein [Marinoscillum sp. MHG1-6]
MYEKLEQCPSCKHTQFNNFLICKDLLASEESFALVRCTKCQLVFTNPRVSPDHLKDYQFSLDMGNQPFLVRQTYKHLYFSFYKEQLKSVFNYSQPTNILDLSNHHLSYSRFLSNKGWNVTSQPFDINNQDTFLDSLSKDKTQTYSSILCLNTLQRIYDVKRVIKLLRKKLNPEGYLFISLPNYQSIEAKHSQQSWPGYDVPRTQYHFNQQAFSIFLKANKLNLIDAIPITTYGRYLHFIQQLVLKEKISVKRLIEKTRQSNKLAKSDTADHSMYLYVLSK